VGNSGLKWFSFFGECGRTLAARHHTHTRTVVLRVWCGAVGRCSCGGAVVVVHGAWCMVHGAVVIVACKN
jgi:hypothetical protein